VSLFEIFFFIEKNVFAARKKEIPKMKMTVRSMMDFQRLVDDM
jgi:hypothetical protein